MELPAGVGAFVRQTDLVLWHDLLRVAKNLDMSAEIDDFVSSDVVDMVKRKICCVSMS